MNRPTNHLTLTRWALLLQYIDSECIWPCPWRPESGTERTSLAAGHQKVHFQLCCRQIVQVNSCPPSADLHGEKGVLQVGCQQAS